MTYHNYNGYYKFLIDPAQFNAMLQEISPGFNADGEPVSQIELAIDSLINEKTGSPVH